MVGPGAACDGEGAGSAGFESLLGACCFIILSHQDSARLGEAKTTMVGRRAKRISLRTNRKAACASKWWSPLMRKIHNHINRRPFLGAR